MIARYSLHVISRQAGHLRSRADCDILTSSQSDRLPRHGRSSAGDSRTNRGTLAGSILALGTDPRQERHALQTSSKDCEQLAKS